MTELKFYTASETAAAIDDWFGVLREASRRDGKLFKTSEFVTIILLRLADGIESKFADKGERVDFCKIMAVIFTHAANACPTCEDGATGEAHFESTDGVEAS